MENIRNRVFGITLGDAAGIGPELIVKMLNKENIRNIATWLVVGDLRVFQQGQSIAGMELNINVIDNYEQLVEQNGQIYFIDLKNLSPDDYELGKVSAIVGKVTGDTLKYIIDISNKHKLDGILYAPLNKEAMQRGGLKFKDELHFFADLLESEHGFGEINIMDELWVTRVTSHIPMKEVSENLTKEKILDRIQFAHRNLSKAGIENPRIFVASYNPHSGEGGLVGREEIDEIMPAVEQAQKEGINVEGPFSADTIFLRRETDPFDCILSMYHDQAQIGIKLLGFNRGVTMSAGFNVTLVTPAHGTAFDIAGQGVANEGATIAAFNMLVRMSSNKKNY